MTGRAATAFAERLGTAPVTFPGDHDGFLGGESARRESPRRSPPPCVRSSVREGEAASSADIRPRS